VVLVDPDTATAATSLQILTQAGLDVAVTHDAEGGLKKLAAVKPDVLMVDLELPGKDGTWLLRKLRDDFMGRRPRLVVMARAEAIAKKDTMIGLGIDAVILKPVQAPALLAATADSGRDNVNRDIEALRQLIELSILEGDLAGALSTLAKKLTLVTRASECVVMGDLGDRHFMGTSSDTANARAQAAVASSWDLSRLAVDARAPVFAPTQEGKVCAYLAVPLESTGGARLGVLMLCDDNARLLPPLLLDGLRALARRLYAELLWRSVHERIAADRDKLHESSMLDPMLGVLTQAAMEQALPQEIQTCRRRGEPVTLALVDVRGLRHLNERHGHAVGDAALRHVAQTLRKGLRAQDLIARHGGNAMALVLPGLGLAEGQRAVEKLQQRLTSSPFQRGEINLSLAVAAGLSTLVHEEESAKAGLLRAAHAVRLAKERGEPLAVADAKATVAQPSNTDTVIRGELEPGATLGGMYQILHEISHGAMGVVYRAEDLALGRPVALKMLKPELSRDQSVVSRFRSEAAMLAKVHHENLVQVYSLGTIPEGVYFAMELVEGEPLDDRIELMYDEASYLLHAEVARIITQVASALDAMHRAGVLHRDVKPANVLLDRVRDRAVLVDVGIAKQRGTEKDPAGTPGFTAVEAFTGGVEGPATDVYGLAATAYMLLTREAPFGDDSARAILRRQMSGAPSLPSQQRPGLTAEVDTVLMRALDASPGKRYATATDFAKALSAALSECPELEETTRERMRARAPDVGTLVRHKRRTRVPLTPHALAEPGDTEDPPTDPLADLARLQESEVSRDLGIPEPIREGPVTMTMPLWAIPRPPSDDSNS
jgi:serine/threonine-protein kinase